MKLLILSKVSHISFWFMVLGIPIQKGTKTINIKIEEISPVVKQSIVFKNNI